MEKDMDFIGDFQASWVLVEQNFTCSWIPGSNINTKKIFFNGIPTRTQITLVLWGFIPSSPC